MNKSISLSLAILIAGCTSTPRTLAPAAEPAGAPAPEYRSAFADYHGFADEELAPWRDVNDEVGRVGGHVGILKSHGAHK